MLITQTHLEILSWIPYRPGKQWKLVSHRVAQLRKKTIFGIIPHIALLFTSADTHKFNFVQLSSCTKFSINQFSHEEFYAGIAQLYKPANICNIFLLWYTIQKNYRKIMGSYVKLWEITEKLQRIARKSCEITENHGKLP